MQLLTHAEKKSSHNLSVVWFVKRNSKPYVAYVFRLSVFEINVLSNGAKHQKVKEVQLSSYTYNWSAEPSSGNVISEMDQFGSQSGILVNVSWNRPTSSCVIARASP